jgi:two-component system nitrate/nitrite response regulator NarL
MSRTRLLLLGDHLLFREGLSRLLSAERDFHLVAQCATFAEALNVLERHAVDMVVLDCDFSKGRGFDSIHKVRESRYRGRLFILTDGMNGGDAVRALWLGACGIFLKSRPPKELSDAIRRVMAGETWVDESCIRALTQAIDRSVHREQRRKLTERERLVLRHVSEGLTNKEIAATLNVTEGSVKSALQQLFVKTGVHKRSQLVRIALEQSAAHR